MRGVISQLVLLIIVYCTNVIVFIFCITYASIHFFHCVIFSTCCRSLEQREAHAINEKDFRAPTPPITAPLARNVVSQRGSNTSARFNYNCAPCNRIYLSFDSRLLLSKKGPEETECSFLNGDATFCDTVKLSPDIERFNDNMLITSCFWKNTASIL